MSIVFSALSVVSRRLPPFSFSLRLLFSTVYPYCHRIDAFPSKLNTRRSSHQLNMLMPGSPKLVDRLTALRRLQPHKAHAAHSPR
jgi:hypothetical protein